VHDPLTRFRYVALAEGVSYVVLVFVGMPLKYLAGRPSVVEVTGWIHGVLFICYLLFGLQVALDESWSMRFSAWAFVASLVPGGTFVLDHYLRSDVEVRTSTE
jgi:integral membrane protein